MLVVPRNGSGAKARQSRHPHSLAHFLAHSAYLPVKPITPHVKKLLSYVFCFTFLTACFATFTKPAAAGGPVSLSRTAIYGTQTAYLSCSCEAGYYDVVFQNNDTVPLTVTGTNWSVGPIPAGQETTYHFTDPGFYAFSLAEATSLSGSVTIINSPPEFSTASLSVTNITTSKLSLSWPAATDDGSSITYKVYQNNILIKSTAEQSLEVSGLTQNTLYTFKVVAYDSSNASSETVLTTSAVTKKVAVPSPSVTPPKASSATSTPTPEVAASSEPTPTTEATNSPTIVPIGGMDEKPASVQSSGLLGGLVLGIAALVYLVLSRSKRS